MRYKKKWELLRESVENLILVHEKVDKSMVIDTKEVVYGAITALDLVLYEMDKLDGK